MCDCTRGLKDSFIVRFIRLNVEVRGSVQGPLGAPGWPCRDVLIVL